MNISAFFLVGPTATGKSRVAQYIAEKYKYAILSADSMAVYRGMDIGTAKPTLGERQRVSYGCIDIVDATEDFNVADYRKFALQFLREKAKEKMPVLIVGGSGLYIKSLTHGLDDAAGYNHLEREEWLKFIEKHGIDALRTEVVTRYPSVKEELKDLANPRRLIRYMEKKMLNVQIKSSWNKLSCTVPMVGLDMHAPVFRMAVKMRVEQMYRNGLINECIKLTSGGRKLSRTARQAIGYAEVISFLEGQCSMQEAVERTIVRTIQLGKKQRTWFRNQAKVEWIKTSLDMDVEEVAHKVLALWGKYGSIPIHECMQE